MDNQTKEIVLERMTYFLTQMLSDEFVTPPDVDIRLEVMADRIVGRIQQDIWCHKLRTVEVEYPADWWQAFKERWFPGWLLDRYPVVYVKEKLEANLLYPDIVPMVQGRRWFLHLNQEASHAD